MTTTEKRGFRLPWGTENRKPEDEPDEALEPRRPEPGAPATDLAPAIATSKGSGVRSGSSLRHDDLGRGPFDLEPDPDPEPEPAPEPEAPVAAVAPVAEAPDGPVAWPDIDRAGSATHLASDAPPPPVRPAITVEGDAAPRRTNPLMAGLVKAMRDAARSARDEATVRMRSDATARLAEIRAQGAAAGLTLKKQADDDLAEIREWSKAETARIRKETDERIATRRADLVRDVADHAAEAQRLQAEVNGAIASFDAEMGRFFDILLSEEDPARLATLAERLPEAPSFARPMGPAGAPMPRARAPRSAGATPRKRAGTSTRHKSSERLAPDAAAAAEAEAIAGLDDTSTLEAPEPTETGAVLEPAAEAAEGTDPAEATTEIEPVAESAAAIEDDPSPDPDEPAGSLATVLAAAPRIDSPDDLSPEERIALLGFDEPEPSADGNDGPAPVLGVPLEPEGDTRRSGGAVAAAPLEDVTRVVVSGLTTVAGISAFKSALGGVSGVISVSVTSGMDHDFVFSVVHADATDLRRAISSFPTFAAQMTFDEGAVVSFNVTEPAA